MSRSVVPERTAPLLQLNGGKKRASQGSETLFQSAGLKRRWRNGNSVGRGKELSGAMNQHHVSPFSTA